MTFLALIAIIFFGFAVYNLTCAFVDIPTKKTSQMMMLSRKQQGTKNEKLLDVYVTKIAGWIAPYLRLDRLKRNKVQRALDIAGLQLTPEVYTTRAWVTAGAVGLCAIPMAFLIPLLVPILIGLAVALWFSTYYAAFDFVKKRRKLIEGEIPRFALTVGQSLENDRDVLKILTSYRRVAGKDFGAELDQTIADMKTGNYENALIRFETRIGSPMLSDVIRGLILVSGSGETEYDALYDLLGSLSIIPTSGPFFLRLASFVKLTLLAHVPVSAARKLFQKDKRTKYEVLVMRLAGQALLSTAEIIKCIDKNISRLPNECALLDSLYGDETTTSDNIASMAKISQSSKPVTLAVANLYLRQQIIFERV